MTQRVATGLTELVVTALIRAAESSTQPTGCVPHHVPTRNAGGKDKDAGPECHRHHDEWHNKLGSRGYEAKHRITCRAIRAALAGHVGGTK